MSILMDKLKWIKGSFILSFIGLKINEVLHCPWKKKSIIQY